MKKSLLITLPMLMSASGLFSQVELRTSDLLRLGMSENKVSAQTGIRKSVRMSEERVEMIVRYDSESALDEMVAAGAEIVSLVGTRTAIVAAAPGMIEGVTGCKGVTGATLSAPVKRANNKAIPASGVDMVRKGLGLPASFDGEGVVLGLFDVGIDPNHINFQDADGNSRVKMLWNYVGQTAKPDVYDTPTKISSFSSDTSSESHGTHVLGIMTGSFMDTSTADAPDYRGVAPGAEIVVAAGTGYNVQILDAIERIGKYAQEQGKPCVINLSFGDNVGPHDGSDEFTEAINDVAAKYNATICLAAGNEADLPIAIVKTLSEGDDALKTLLIKNSDEGGATFQVYGPLEIWTNDDTPFEVTLDIVTRSAPDSPVYSLSVPEKKETYVVQGTNINQFLSNTGRMELISEGTEFQDLYINSFMGGIRGKDSYNGRYYARLNFYIEGRTSSVVSRNFVKVSVKGKPGQKIYMYTDGYYMELGNRNIPGLDVPDGYGTNSNMACGKETFSVGSYVTANVSGSGYPTGAVGQPSYFSSYGETLDGRAMPDISAPGQVIISSRNGAMPTSSTYSIYYPLNYRYTDSKRKKTYYWTSCAGTSQASPHMAGIMALMREANPELTHQEIYEIARNTATEPEKASPAWGSGKVNALEAVKGVLSASSIYDIVDRGEDNIIVAPTGNGYQMFAAGEDALTVEVYDMTGMLHKSVSAKGTTVEVTTSDLSQGIYLIRVKGEKSEKTLKVNI